MTSANVTKGSPAPISVWAKWRQRLGIGVCAYAGSLADFMVSTYLLYYLTNALKLNLASIAGLLVIVRVIDAVGNYFIGLAIDATKSRFGRNRLWMMISVPFVVAGLIGTFTVPSSLLCFEHVNQNVCIPIERLSSVCFKEFSCILISETSQMHQGRHCTRVASLNSRLLMMMT